ncbi:MAG TPA: SWIM zinc finger family protein [Pseudonocardiaceae bacterium]
MKAVTVASIRALAAPRSFARGERYLADGHVRRLMVSGTTVAATVDGTRAYRVRLEVTARGLRWQCSCPHGAEGAFCKHCVAAALSWLEQGGRLGDPRPTALSDARLRRFLLDRDAEWLVDQLMAASASAPLVRARLDVAAGADPSAALDVQRLRERLEFAIDIDKEVDYAAAFDYFRRVDEALDVVAELAGGGFPDVAVDLAEYALGLLEDAAGQVDDSGGGLADALDRVQEILHAARRAGTPDRAAAPPGP